MQSIPMMPEVVVVSMCHLRPYRVNGFVTGTIIDLPAWCSAIDVLSFMPSVFLEFVQ